MQDYDRLIQMAEGYCELGITDEALALLDKLRGKDRSRFEALDVTARCLIAEHSWDHALVQAEIMREFYPEDPAGHLHTAYCMHEMGRTEEALWVMESAPRKLRKRPLYHYNLACYHACLGHLTEAKGFLLHALELEPKLRRTAQKDKDLSPLRGLMGL